MRFIKLQILVVFLTFVLCHADKTEVDIHASMPISNGWQLRDGNKGYHFDIKAGPAIIVNRYYNGPNYMHFINPFVGYHFNKMGDHKQRFLSFGTAYTYDSQSTALLKIISAEVLLGNMAKETTVGGRAGLKFSLAEVISFEVAYQYYEQSSIQLSIGINPVFIFSDLHKGGQLI